MLLLLFSCTASAFDFWQYPEMADRHAFFVGGLVGFFSLDEFFSIQSPYFYVDYLLPVGLPFSVGLSAVALDPDVLRFGTRIGYHVNLDDEFTDLYLVYTLDYLSNPDGRFIEFGGRIGIRRLLGRYICLNIETGFKLLTVTFGISVKLK